MATSERHSLGDRCGLAAHPAKRGGTVFARGLGPCGRDVCLGVVDLYRAFDGRVDSRGKACGWSWALLEMILDPVLAFWVPQFVHEQYRRWNPKFDWCVQRALSDDFGGQGGVSTTVRPVLSNRRLVRRIWQLLGKVQRQAAHRRARGHALVSVSGSGAEDSESHGESGLSSECVSDASWRAGIDTAVKVVIEPRPIIAADSHPAGDQGVLCEALTDEQLLSAAGPSIALPDVLSSDAGASMHCIDGRVAAALAGYAGLIIAWCLVRGWSASSRLGRKAPAAMQMQPETSSLGTLWILGRNLRTTSLARVAVVEARLGFFCLGAPVQGRRARSELSSGRSAPWLRRWVHLPMALVVASDWGRPLAALLFI